VAEVEAAKMPVAAPSPEVVIPAGASSPASPPPVSQAPTLPVNQPEMPDYGTKLAEWVEAHQPDPNAHNHWAEFVTTVSSLSGAWDTYAAGNAALSARAAQEQAEGLQVLGPARVFSKPGDKTLLPEMSAFFRALAKTDTLKQLDDLTGPWRFTALRPTETLLETSIPEFSRAHQAVHLCKDRMRVMLLEGQPEQAVRSLQHGLAIQRALQGRGMVISGAIADTCRGHLVREIRAELLANLLDATTARQMLEADEAPLADMVMAYGGERFLSLQAIDWYFAKFQEETKGSDGTSPAPPVAPREEQMALANRLYDGCEALFSADEAERARGREMIAEVERIIDANEDHYKPLSTLRPEVWNLNQKHTATAVLHAGVRTMLGLELFRLRMGHYPETLAELVPADLAVLPVDPLAKDHQFRYKRKQDQGGTAATGYVLYSVGTDGEDNGGKPHPSNVMNALGGGRFGDGYDYIINDPNG
jgi:hypothetical protein